MLKELEKNTQLYNETIKNMFFSMDCIKSYKQVLDRCMFIFKNMWHVAICPQSLTWLKAAHNLMLLLFTLEFQPHPIIQIIYGCIYLL